MKKRFDGELKRIYTSVNEDLLELESFSEKWDKKYPVISDIWRRNWPGIITLFGFPPDIRKAIYTTNAIESTNRH